MTAATTQRKARSVPFRGGDYVANLMSELSRAGIAERIQQAREQTGLTQQELADLLYVHVRSVQGWESRKHPIVAYDRMGEIASTLGVTKEWLLHGTAETRPEDVLRVRVVDALQALEESQESVHQRLSEVSAALSRIEAKLSTQREPQRAPGTTD